jgi:hypothetical protein
MKEMNLVLCELYNPKLHHYSDLEEDWKDVATHWLNIYTIPINYNKSKINKYIKQLKNNLKLYSHPYIRNYENIIIHKNYFQIHLVKNIELPTGETICIIKTYWLRIIQRTWKRIYKERKEMIEKRKNINSIIYSQVYGKWPENCLCIPKLKIS